MNATQQQGTHTPHSTSLNMRNTNKNMTNMKTLASGEFKEMKKNKRVGKSMGQYVPWIVLAYLVGIACGIFMTPVVECEVKNEVKGQHVPTPPPKQPDKAEGECNRLQAELNYLRTTIARQQELERQVRDSQIQQQRWEQLTAEREKLYQEQWMRAQQMWGAELENRLELMQRQWNVQEANRVAEEEQHLAENLEQQFAPMMVSPRYGAMPPPLPYEQEDYSMMPSFSPEDESASYNIDGLIDGTMIDESNRNDEDEEILPTLEMSPSMMTDDDDKTSSPTIFPRVPSPPYSSSLRRTGISKSTMTSSSSTSSSSSSSSAKSKTRKKKKK